MLVAPIRNALENIRDKLLNLTGTGTPTYDAQPLVDVVKEVIDVINRNGVPEFTTTEVKSIDPATTDTFNKISSEAETIIGVITRILDELTQMTNSSLEKYTISVNKIEPLMEDLRQRINDVEQQTLEKVNNQSIHSHEIKNISFTRTVLQSTLSVVNNAVILPVAAQISLPINDVALTIRQSEAATLRLDQNIVSTEDKSDAETIIGTYFGHIIGRLDGSEAFISEDETDVTNLFNHNINEQLIANFYTNQQRDELEIGVESIFSEEINFNFIKIDSNVTPTIYSKIGSDNVKLNMKNNIWAMVTNATSLLTVLKQTHPERLVYQGIDIVDKETSTIVRRHNYFSSMQHDIPKRLEELNDGITTTPITVTPNQAIRLENREGFYRYGIEVNSIEIYQNQYESTGIWSSDLLVTDRPITSIQLESEHFIPDDDIEYIKYEVSFNKAEWYQVKPYNVGVTQFNLILKTRVVLDNDNTNPDYLYIGKQTNDRGLYLRVTMATNDGAKTPVIYNLQLKIKVASEE